jgi:hypothetical protein
LEYKKGGLPTKSTERSDFHYSHLHTLIVSIKPSGRKKKLKKI